MTYKIAKSQAFHGFEAAVAAYASEVREWRAHMARVEADKKANVDISVRHVPYPAPGAHPLVAEAINENGVADYEIVDDGPKPEEILRAKKNDLLRKVCIAEEEAKHAVIPPAKMRLLGLREGQVRAADSSRAADILAGRKGTLRKIGEAVGVVKPEDMAAAIESGRPKADTEFLAEQQSRNERIVAIERVGAQMHFDIEDLTLETIDAWVMTEFPK